MVLFIGRCRVQRHQRQLPSGLPTSWTLLLSSSSLISLTSSRPPSLTQPTPRPPPGHEEDTAMFCAQFPGIPSPSKGAAAPSPECHWQRDVHGTRACKAGFHNPGLGNSLLRGEAMLCGTDVQPHPQPLPTQCQQHCPSSEDEKCLQMLPIVPGEVKSSLI